MGSYKIQKIDCLMGTDRENCAGSVGFVRGEPVIIFRIREDRLVDLINGAGEFEFGWAASAINVLSKSSHD